MGASSSTNAHRLAQPEDSDNNAAQKEALLLRTQTIRRWFPIVEPDGDSITPNHAAFISPDSPPILLTLPFELIESIANHLDNGSIKHLRLTCKLLSATRLRINRVFLSANPLNIQVFRSIADHDVYRQSITEIIYDDALLCHSFNDHISDLHRDTVSWLETPTNMEWYLSEGDKNLDGLINRRSRDNPNRPQNREVARQVNAELPLEESWAYYQDLLRQQDEVVASGADAEALRYGLRRFPALRRVTVTPAAHGWLYTPLYETPMIRAFPYGFNHPIPRGWPTRRSDTVTADVGPWEDAKARWRGYSIVTRALAQEQQHHRVSEYLIDSHYLGTGLNPRLFEQSCEEYLDLLSVLRQPHLKKFHLSLYLNGRDASDPDWAALRNNLLRNALAEARGLEHFSIDTSWNQDHFAGEVPPLTLETFLPIDRWERLQHFRLWNFPVLQTDLISTLSQLPELRSLELGHLDIYPGNYHDLLNEMRDTLRWHERHTQPKVTIVTPVPGRYIQGRAIWADEEVDKFLYGNGENPFTTNDGDTLGHGMGTIRDAYDPGYARPY